VDVVVEEEGKLNFPTSPQTKSQRQEAKRRTEKIAKGEQAGGPRQPFLDVGLGGCCLAALASPSLINSRMAALLLSIRLENLKSSTAS
jgi:hypothetical protein